MRMPVNEALEISYYSLSCCQMAIFQQLPLLYPPQLQELLTTHAPIVVKISVYERSSPDKLG
ncbi:hypothetical protein HZS_3106 [Henneguya salminicola]|nr:hypothetical protein HZS_3106 [Henneguya salminicola]